MHSLNRKSKLMILLSMLKRFTNPLSLFKSKDQNQTQYSQEIKLQIKVNEKCVFKKTLNCVKKSAKKSENVLENYERRKSEVNNEKISADLNLKIHLSQLEKALQESNYQGKRIEQNTMLYLQDLQQKDSPLNNFVQKRDNNQVQKKSCDNKCSDYSHFELTHSQSLIRKLQIDSKSFISSIAHKSCIQQFQNPFQQDILNKSHHPALVQTQKYLYNQEISKDQMLGLRLISKFKDQQKLQAYCKYPQTKGTSKKNLSNQKKNELFDDIEFILQQLWQQTQKQYLNTKLKQSNTIISKSQMQRSALASLGSYIRQYIKRDKRSESLEALMKVYQSRDYIHIDQKQEVFINKQKITINKPRAFLLQSIKQIAKVISDTRRALKVI